MKEKNVKKIKETNRKVMLFPTNSKPICFRHCDIEWSDQMFIRFYTENGDYKCFSGAYLTEQDD
ncbi:MAG: hypothetical protein NC222_06505 [Staphylococcus sp.]|nr:hypothetical protein [Staphylococcus sp.]